MMTNSERKYFVGMVSGWITVAILAMYAFVWNDHECAEPAATKRQSATEAREPHTAVQPGAAASTTPSAWPATPIRLASEVAPTEPTPLYVSEADVEELGDHRPNPLLAIAPTHDEMAALIELRDEYRDALAEATEDLEGDELRAAVEEISEDYLPRFEALLGKERLEILADQTRRAVIAGGYAERLSQDQQAIVNDMAGVK